MLQEIVELLKFNSKHDQIKKKYQNRYFEFLSTIVSKHFDVDFPRSFIENPYISKLLIQFQNAENLGEYKKKVLIEYAIWSKFRSDNKNKKMKDYNSPLFDFKVRCGQRIRNVVFDKIILDFDIPSDSRMLKNKNVSELEDIEIQKKSLKKLKESLLFLKQKNEPIYQFITSFTTVIHLRENSLKNEKLASNNFEIGATLFCGLLNENVTREGIIEGLLHEAIHHFLNQYELYHKEMFPKTTSPIMTKSPWSMNSLSVHNLIHASFVWYGLYHFFRQTVPNLKKIQFIESGFSAVPSPSSQIRSAYPEISPNVLKQIEQIQNEFTCK